LKSQNESKQQQCHNFFHGQIDFEVVVRKIISKIRQKIQW